MISETLPTASFDVTNEIRQIWNTLQVVIKQAGFLVDNTAINMVEKCTQDKQHLMRLDNILNAIGVSSWEDVHKLKQKFENILKSRYTTNSEYLNDSNLVDDEQHDEYLKVI